MAFNFRKYIPFAWKTKMPTDMEWEVHSLHAYKDKKEKPKDMYDDIPKVVMPEPIPLEIDLEFAKKIFPEKNAEDAILERLKSKPDPDLQRGLGSITYKLNKD